MYSPKAAQRPVPTPDTFGLSSKYDVQQRFVCAVDHAISASEVSGSCSDLGQLHLKTYENRTYFFQIKIGPKNLIAKNFALQ